MNSLATLKKIIKSLQKQELKVALAYLKEFDSRKGAKETLGYQIVAKLLKTPRISAETLKKQLAPEVQYRTFERTMQRTKRKVLESMVLPLNTARENAYWKQHQVYFDLMDRMKQAWVLYGRGKDELAMQLYVEVTELGKQFGHYQLVSEAYMHLAQMEMVRLNKDNSATLKSFEHFTDVAYRHQKIILIDGALLQKIEFQIAQEAPEYSYPKAIDYAKSTFEFSQSPTAYYFYLKFKMDQAKLQNKWDVVVSIGADILKHLDANTAIANQQRFGNTWAMMAHGAMVAYQWNHAEAYIQRAKEFFTKNSFNYQNIVQYEFLASVYQGDLDKAVKLINQLLKITNQVSESRRYAIRQYYRACTLYLQKRFGQAGLLLAEKTGGLDKYRDNWNIGVRMLTIMMQMEEPVAYKFPENFINALLQHVREVSKTGSVSPRNLLIIRVLKLLVRKGFDFEAANQEAAEDILLLTVSPDYRWDPFSAEIIRFDVWFIAKLEDSGYDVSDLNSTNGDEKQGVSSTRD